MIDITPYIPDILAFIGGGGLVYFLNWSANRRKANAEAKSSELQNDASVNDLVTVNLNLMREQNDEINELRDENRFCKGLLCRHGACVFRDPIRGKGHLWFTNHKDDDDNALIDVKTMNEIALENDYIIRYDPDACDKIRERKRKKRVIRDTAHDDNGITTEG